MRRILLLIFLVLFLAAIGAAWILLGPGTGFEGRKGTLYISSAAPTREAVLDSIGKRQIVRSPRAFQWLASRLGYWGRIHPGKYEFSEGTSLLTIVRTLRNGTQTPVKLTIKKLRTPGDLAEIVGNKFEMDSAQFMAFFRNPDSMAAFKVTPDKAMTLIFPDTYTYNWTAGPRQVLRKLADVAAGFWTNERLDKAKKLGLSKEDAYTLASIVEEETNAQEEKGNIASVYLNRMHKGMRLQADPTVKYAVGDFSITRVLQVHTAVASPFNTYQVTGLPPGPICTPQRKTIDAVLDSPKTDYLFFVANPEKPGTHTFTATYGEHLANAKAYHQALDERAQKNKSSER
ncbi:endolytic transglycosylase MltG [Flaviaesturariibacter flavus]|uniref:Endolytic murein transglycosylase n=1 Tax=Flaviaesturariibacter flavus TaxID=2502780 RepID=A0A4R1BPM2_9BACT|nr:endolytic transglycosylase MltG [Flaviaesturariibacter flavus]TCJ19277.1 endolytic transglycosylase MltG [Flaviaesturariibacter flavus]